MKFEVRTLNEQAYDDIRAGLISGHFQPGQPLVIRSLATEYGISATPVRDALQRLVAEHLLVMLPNRSIIVPHLSISEFVELVRIRSALEGLAGELATPRLEHEDLQQLRELLQQGEAAIARKDGRSYVKINQRFHFVIYDRCGSPILVRMIKDLWSQVGPFFTRLFDDEVYVSRANDEHRYIVSALEERGAAEVRRHLVRDIAIAADTLTQRL